MPGSTTIDLTGGDSDSDPPRAAPGRPDPRPDGTLDTGAAVRRDHGHVCSFRNTSLRNASPTQASSVPSQGPSSRQIDQPEPQEPAPGPPAKRQKVQGSEDLSGGFQDHKPRNGPTEASANKEDPIDITEEAMRDDPAPTQQQAQSSQLLYFGSLHDTPVSIDMKPGANVELDIRKVKGNLVVVTVKEGAGHAQRPLATIGRVTKSHHRKFMLSILASGEARATINAGGINTITNPGARQDRNPTVTVEIYCPVSLYKGIAKHLLTNTPNSLCTTSPAIAHYMACTLEQHGSVTATKAPQAVVNKSTDRDSLAECSIVIQRAIQSLRAENSLPETEAPPEVEVELLPHQKRGLTFMKGKETGSLPHDVSIQEVHGGYGRPCFQDVLSGKITSTRPSHECGGIISDIMGMGKTLTMIAFILLRQPQARSWADSDRRADEPPRSMATLVVVPAGLLQVWELELSRRTSLEDGAYYIYHGDKRAPLDLTSKKHIIVLTSLDLLRRGGERDAELLFKTSWYRVVYDEAHNLKSRNSQRFKNAKRVHSKYTWAVTGTPIMISINEIQALFELCGTPNLNNPAGFEKHLLGPIRLDAVDCAQRVSIVTRTNILRRIPDDSTFHARKRYLVARVSLSKAERALYDEAREKANVQLQNAKSVSCALSQFHGMRKICSLGAAYRIAEKDTPAHIIHFRALRDGGATCEVCDNIPTAEAAEYGLVCRIMPCDHIICAECVTQGTTACPVCEDEDRDAASPGQPVTLSELNATDKTLPTPTYDTMSDKMRFVLDEVQTHRDAKIVILASYVDTVKVLSRILGEHDIQHASVHGDVTQNTRGAEIKRFKETKDCRVLVATIGTMGEGQNLAAASRLICLDIEWNPKRMRQAYARVERIDQTHDVTVIQVVTADTVDEKILAISNKRNKFADAILTEWVRPERDATAELEEIKTWCRA